MEGSGGRKGASSLQVLIYAILVTRLAMMAGTGWSAVGGFLVLFLGVAVLGFFLVYENRPRRVREVVNLLAVYGAVWAATDVVGAFGVEGAAILRDPVTYLAAVFQVVMLAAAGLLGAGAGKMYVGSERGKGMGG